MAKRWKPLPLGTHVTIDGMINGVVTDPLPRAPGQVYAVRTTSRVERIHVMRLTVRRESKATNV